MEPDDPRREWLPRRSGDKPRTTPDDPHRQLTQIAPVEMQELVVEQGRKMAGTYVCPSLISIPGSRAFVLDDSTPTPSSQVFMTAREFAHIHPPVDGSLHMVLPPHIVRQVVERGWGEQHPVAMMGLVPPTTMMIYGPRDPAEVEVVLMLLKASWGYARGELAG
ncbi:MAG TPA: luciferase family protein [Actinomycetota bacterium]|nr:luciferase family protein [Actinomycetota bacterium]